MLTKHKVGVHSCPVLSSRSAPQGSSRPPCSRTDLLAKVASSSSSRIKFPVQRSKLKKCVWALPFAIPERKMTLNEGETTGMGLKHQKVKVYLAMRKLHFAFIKQSCILVCHNENVARALAPLYCFTLALPHCVSHTVSQLAHSLIILDRTFHTLRSGPTCTDNRKL